MKIKLVYLRFSSWSKATVYSGTACPNRWALLGTRTMRALCRPQKTSPWWSACCLALSSSTYHSFYDLILLIFLFLQPMANFILLFFF